MKELIFNLAHPAYLAQASVSIDGQPYNTDLPTVGASSDTVQVILQFVFAGIGALALIIIIIAAIQFVTSGGDPQETAKARNTLLYAAIGLIVAVSAEVLVTFVLNNI
ncbi:MAG TPA: hypothetical protein VMR95_03760 [Candidatus Binatia bacterium]|jgi:hypothetical protein|nr:hypothetical protein [Candidatus Binatia bacterium]